MSPNHFPEDPPGITDFTSLVSNVSQLLSSDLRTRIRNELDPLQVKAAPRLANEAQGVSAHDALLGAVDDLAKAKEEIDALNAYFDAAAKHAYQQLKFHSDLKTYFERTTDQLALRSELGAPIRKLPNEILQLIFLEVHAQASRKGRYNPVTAQVCTFWRQLALATPVLWTSVNVNLTDDEENGLQAVDHMKAHIERAKRRLVTVRLCAKSDKFEYRLFDWVSDEESTTVTNVLRSHRHLKAAITTLLQYSDKVGSLNIPRHNKELGSYLETMCTTEGVTFDKLHTLSLYEDDGCPRDFDAKPLLKACPNISRLRIYEAPDTPDIHWEKMKEFKGRLEIAALTTFLSRAQDVKQAEIWSSWWHLVPDITFSARLTALSLNHIYGSSATALANVPPPPGLRYLALSDDYDSASTLLHSWGSNLEFLGLSFTITAKDMKNLLPTVPKLRCLRLCGDRATPPNLFNLLPELTHIEIHAGVNTFSEVSVRKLLSRPLKRTSRVKQLPLRSVSFLPTRSRRFYGEPDERAGSFEWAWKGLYQDLKLLSITVHEYRNQKTTASSVFGTAFFKEQGFRV